MMVPLADGESEEEELLPSRRASLRFEIRSFFGGYFCFICFPSNSIPTSCFHADCFQGSTSCIIRDYAYVLQPGIQSVKVISRHFLIFFVIKINLPPRLRIPENPATFNALFDYYRI